mmetsp:Transcript_29831/g.75918  ORF Transcript_29831/g.75918 Transcript_29831/m.75918 type:complete len:223 (+) Transcript_29831:521-1189(+)
MTCSRTLPACFSLLIQAPRLALTMTAPESGSTAMMPQGIHALWLSEKNSTGLPLYMPPCSGTACVPGAGGSARCSRSALDPPDECRSGSFRGDATPTRESSAPTQTKGPGDGLAPSCPTSLLRDWPVRCSPPAGDFRKGFGFGILDGGASGKPSSIGILLHNSSVLSRGSSGGSAGRGDGCSTGPATTGVGGAVVNDLLGPVVVAGTIDLAALRADQAPLAT